MSSFVVSKAEYARTAGIVAGMVEGIKKANNRDLWIYDHESKRNSTREDFFDRFTAFYDLNALSVQMQYGDKEREEDAGDYTKEFSEARAKVYEFTFQNLIQGNKKPILSLLRQLSSCFDCMLYQVEFDPYWWKMSIYMNNVYRVIADALLKQDEAWQSAEEIVDELKAPEHKVEILF